MFAFTIVCVYNRLREDGAFVSWTDPQGIEFYSYANFLFCVG